MSIKFLSEPQITRITRKGQRMTQIERYLIVPLLSEMGIPRYRIEKAVYDLVDILNIMGVDTSELEVKAEVCYDVPRAVEKINVEFIV